MPLTAGGKLNIVASSDLGGTGRAGRHAGGISIGRCPAIAPLLLPWLAILGLLALKPNRHAAAWLIWLPLGCVAALTVLPPLILPSGANFLLDVIAALAIGLAAVWLLSSYLRRSHRVLTFFVLLLTLAGFSVLAAAARQGWDLFNDASLEVGIVLAFAVPANALAVSLCGLLCRGRYRPIGLYVWLLLCWRASGWSSPCRSFWSRRPGERKHPVERIFHARSGRGGGQFRLAPAVPDFVLGQPVFPRAAQGAAECAAGRAAAIDRAGTGQPI